ncbi:MAG: hypothetical protein M3R30_05475 [Candidatus Eremiobacteraeota bacterium]|nr:hypothetical protein [Candidatus Eremiobacteraeota bacterium]
MGGKLAQYTAAERPANLERLILIAPGARGAGPAGTTAGGMPRSSNGSRRSTSRPWPSPATGTRSRLRAGSSGTSPRRFRDACSWSRHRPQHSGGASTRSRGSLPLRRPRSGIGRKTEVAARPCDERA